MQSTHFLSSMAGRRLLHLSKKKKITQLFFTHKCEILHSVFLHKVFFPNTTSHTQNFSHTPVSPTAKQVPQTMMGIGGQIRDQSIPDGGELLPFNHTAIVAPTDSGKTSVILNFFINIDLLEKMLAKYHYIIIVSKHANEDCVTGYELMMARNHHGKF